MNITVVHLVAQGDLQIATKQGTNFMAFVSNKAITNRKNFVSQLKMAVSVTNFNDVRFLMTLDEILGKMHSPCLRLEVRFCLASGPPFN
jgi:hypothetical protein